MRIDFKPVSNLTGQCKSILVTEGHTGSLASTELRTATNENLLFLSVYNVSVYNEYTNENASLVECDCLIIKMWL